MRSHLRTPLLVNVGDFRTPESYLLSLRKKARWKWRCSEVDFGDFTYREVPYDGGQVRYYMRLWEGQRVNGSPTRWVFGPDYFDRLASQLHLRIFIIEYAHCDVAMHPVEQFGPLLYTQPVLYDKEVFPGAARFMWFKLMFWAIRDHETRWIDLGGGFHGTWQDFLRNRSDAAFKYKWDYVPKSVKENPNAQIPYFVQRCGCGYKQLVTALRKCPGCSSSGPS